MPDLQEIKGAEAFSILRSKDYDCFPMAQAYQDISDATGIDFTNVVQFLNCMPTFLNGEAHKSRRAELARLYGQQTEVLAAKVEASLSVSLAAMAQREGAFDVLNECVRPMWRALAQTFLPEDLTYTAEMENLPVLFTPHTSLVKRKKCETLLRGCVDAYGPDILNNLALATLGSRPFVNGFALSIHALADAHQGSRLCDVVYPSAFPATGLRYVDRIAKRAGKAPEGSDGRFRCVIFDDEYTAAENAKFMFGTGAHLCIGRQVSLMAWRVLCEGLGKIDKQIAPGVLKVHPSEPFDVVTHCTINIG